MSVRCPALLAVALAAGAFAPAATAASQDVTAGGAQGLRFSPEAVAVRPGEAVRWTNAGGTHNVVFDDGAPAQPPSPLVTAWVESRTFTTEGVVRFQCGLHGASMAGVVYVNASGTVPGTTTPPAPSPPPPIPSPPSPPAADDSAPRLSRAAAIRDHFCTRRGATCRRPGVTLTFSLSEAATVTARVERRPLRRSRRGGGPPGRGRFIPAGTVGLRGVAGANRSTFTETATGRRLGPADYRLTLTATDDAGNRSTPATVRFFVRPS